MSEDQPRDAAGEAGGSDRFPLPGPFQAGPEAAPGNRGSGAGEDSDAEENVLASLPRHRPGRSTARREAARARRTAPAAAAKRPAKAKRATAAKAAAKPKPARRPAGKAARATTAAAAATTEPAAGREPVGVPAQGFEAEEVRMGVAVDPPSRVQMAASLIEAAAEGFGELAKAGAEAGGDVLKRALSLLPKP
jgi:hypothetical protein